jgi:hypothetical protein
MNNHITLIDARKSFFAMCDRLDLAPNFALTASVIKQIRDCAMRLSSIAERECNGVNDPKHPGCQKWDDKDQAHADRVHANNERKILAALESVFDNADFSRLEIEFQGDPRGPSVIIHERGGMQRLASFW